MQFLGVLVLAVYISHAVNGAFGGVNMNSRQAIHVLFLEPNRSDHIINRLTGMVGKLLHGRAACHVEICIPDAGGYLSCSIYNGEKVSLNYTKRFANPDYAVHTIDASSGQISAIKGYLSACHARGDSFDSVGMYLATLPFSVPRKNNQSTFCSKLVCEALQKGGVKSVQGLNPNCVSPSRLWKLLRKNDPSMCGSVRYKEMQLLERGAMETRGLLNGCAR